jgi:hypothetical protein
MKKIFIPLASDLMSSDEQLKLIESYNPIFEKYGIVQSILPLPKSDVYFFILTGGTENKFLKVLSKMKSPHKIKLIAIGMNNSLPASLEILAYVNQNGIDGHIYYLKNEKDFDALKN